ncbi:MAG: hypothetical protein P8I26_07015 [Flavobacteriaceae bacterium]|nr:hypothetical protein [Flavobacteriaceae bacterium]
MILLIGNINMSNVSRLWRGTLSINKNSIQEQFEKIKNAEEALHVKHFIHQRQNVKYLINACPDQCFTSEKDLKKWLDDYELDNNILSKNNQISSNLFLESFEELSDKLSNN